jgi:hypothetical protein
MDDEFVTFDPNDEPPSPPRASASRRARPAGAAPAQQQQQRQAAAPSVPQAQAHRLPNGMVPVGGGGSSRMLLAPVGASRPAPPQPPPAPAAAAAAPPAHATRAIAAGGPRAAAAAAKRTMHTAAQRIRSSSNRQSSGDLKGRPSFAELVESGFMQVCAGGGAPVRGACVGCFSTSVRDMHFSVGLTAPLDAPACCWFLAWQRRRPIRPFWPCISPRNAACLPGLCLPVCLPAAAWRLPLHSWNARHPRSP